MVKCYRASLYTSIFISHGELTFIHSEAVRTSTGLSATSEHLLPATL